MEMPSVTFLHLLEEGIKQQAEDWKVQSAIAMAPEMKGEDWKKFIKNLDRMTPDTDTIEVDNIEKLKEVFGQK